ncbi:MAG: hypothetical protein WC184_11140 [Acidimicrobiia bacterium]
MDGVATLVDVVLSLTVGVDDVEVSVSTLARGGVALLLPPPHPLTANAKAAANQIHRLAKAAIFIPRP